MKPSRRVYGLHAAEAIIVALRASVISAYVDSARRDERLTRLFQSLADAGIPIERMKRQQLDLLAGGGNHQGIILEVELPQERDEDELAERLAKLDADPLLLVLDRVQDPHNLGACLRTADAVGACGVVIPKDQSVGLTPTVAKVASGAAESVPLYRVTNLSRCLDGLKNDGLWIVGASGDAAKSVYEADLTGPIALVLGSEGKGIRHLTQKKCDYLVKIPMAGSVDSLNVSVAAGVLLYEAVRQRGVHSSSGK